MGEIAEMMLDGTLCEGCGEYIGDGGAGIPRYCSPRCAAGRGVMNYRPPAQRSRGNQRKAERINGERQARAAASKPFKCPSCGKRFRHSISVQQHQRDVHSPVPAAK